MHYKKFIKKIAILHKLGIFNVLKFMLYKIQCSLPIFKFLIPPRKFILEAIHEKQIHIDYSNEFSNLDTAH